MQSIFLSRIPLLLAAASLPLSVGTHSKQWKSLVVDQALVHCFFLVGVGGTTSPGKCPSSSGHGNHYLQCPPLCLLQGSCHSSRGEQQQNIPLSTAPKNCHPVAQGLLWHVGSYSSQCKSGIIWRRTIRSIKSCIDQSTPVSGLKTYVTLYHTVIVSSWLDFIGPHFDDEIQCNSISTFNKLPVFRMLSMVCLVNFYSLVLLAEFPFPWNQEAALVKRQQVELAHFLQPTWGCPAPIHIHQEQWHFSQLLPIVSSC